VRRPPRTVALALGLGLPSILLSQARIEQRRGSAGVQEEVLYLWSGAQVKRLAPGFESLMADVYWLRTVQYYGGQRLFSTGKRFELLEPLIEITTALDPRLEIAYRYGAIFLCERWPNGKGDPEAGIRLLERGVRNLPRSWRIRQDLGYFRYVFLGDAKGGAQVLLEAARLPDAPFWLETLAGMVLIRGGERRTARAVWRRMYEQAEGGFIRDNALYNLRRLDGLDAIDVLNAAVDHFRQAHGRPPWDASELRASGAVEARRLVDPTGVPFAYNAATGRFGFSRASRLWNAAP
jgi:hypothetical protein